METTYKNSKPFLNDVSCLNFLNSICVCEYIKKTLLKYRHIVLVVYCFSYELS